jgi:hypothetical protein
LLERAVVETEAPCAEDIRQVWSHLLAQLKPGAAESVSVPVLMTSKEEH